MQFTSILLLASTGLAWPHLSPRDAASIDAAVANISAGITTLNNSLNKFASANQYTSLVDAFQVQTDSDNLGTAVQHATNVTNQSAPLDEEGSGDVAGAVLSIVNPIGSLLQNFINNKPKFDKAAFGQSLSPLVLNSLKNQKNYADQFGAAVKAKLTSDYAALAPQVIAVIDADFDKAIKTYSSSSGYGSYGFST